MITVLRHPLGFPCNLLKLGNLLIQFLELLSALLFDLLVGKGDLPGQFTLPDQQRFFFSCHFRIHSIHPVRFIDGRKYGLQTVIVILSDRIPFVFMATGALVWWWRKSCSIRWKPYHPDPNYGQLFHPSWIPAPPCPIKSHGPAAKNPSASIPSSVFG